MKKQYFARLKPKHEALLIKHFQEEWQQVEKALKKHELIQKAKQAGVGVGKTILGLMLVAGVVTVAAVAPNIFSIFGKAGSYRRHLATHNLNEELRRGSARRYWKYQKMSKDTFRISLTAQGKKIALRNAIAEFRLPVQSKWDQKWRMVIFDIAKKNSGARDMLRRKLHEIGMHPLQESVFVFPYHCTEAVLMWVELFGVEQDVEILEVKFLTDRVPELQKIFHLDA